MTTGRINQISWSRPPGPAPFRINNGRRRVPGGPEPPKGPGCNSVITWKGRTSARPPRQPPAHRGDARTWPSNCPHCSPSDTGPHAGCSTSPPLRALCGLRHTGLGWGVRPRGHADERRLPRGGSPRESGYQDWPAANDPQTPSVPGTKRPPGFGHPSGPTPRPGTFKPGERRHRCGGRPPPFLRRGSRECGSPQRHQPQRGGLPGREGCVGAPAAAFPRGGSFGLCLHHSYIYSPAPLGRPGVPHALQGPEPLPGGPPYYGGGPPGSNSPYPVGHPHQPPGGAPGGLGPPSEGWRATCMGARARGTGPTGEQPTPAAWASFAAPPVPPRTGRGPGVLPTGHHPPPRPPCSVAHVRRFWIYHASARVRAAPLPPSRLHSSPGRPPPSPHPGSARSPSVHGHPNPGAAPGPRPVASRQLADRAGRGPSRAPSCPALAPGLPPSLAPPHPPPPTGQWPPTTRAGVRLCASPRPPHPPAPAPVAAAAALHPTPYTLHPTPYTLHPTSYTLHPTDGATTSRAQPPNSNSTHNSRVESSRVQLGSPTRLV